MHRNHKGVSVGSLVDELLLGHSRVRSVLCWLPVVVHKVVRLQVEKTGAQVATHVWLVAVVVEALASALLHLAQQKTAKGLRRGCRARCGWGWCAWRADLRTWRKGWPWLWTSATLLLRLLQ
jgi:hypothetical protein